LAPHTQLGQGLLASPRVLLAFEGARNLPLHRLEKRRHGRRQSPALAGRYREGARAVRLGEVVDVDPVRRRRLPRREGAHGRQDSALAPGARRTGGVEVEAARADLERKRDRLGRARLPDRRVDRCDLGRRLKRQRGRVEPPP